MTPRDSLSADSEVRKRLVEAVHDINNLLLIIACSSTDAMERCSENDAACDSLLNIREAGTRIAEITAGLQNYFGAAPSGEPTNTVASTSQSQRGTETVMVVDDDSQVRTFLKSALARQGYNILEARHGPAAVAVALRHGGPIHLLITDMLMPEMTGRELAQALRIDFPEIVVLYLSGLHDDSATDLGGQCLDTFVQKPFKMPELLLKVREILDKRIE